MAHEDQFLIWKYYPPTGVLKLFIASRMLFMSSSYLEVLPAYWGIETHRRLNGLMLRLGQFGSTTRLLGY